MAIDESVTKEQSIAAIRSWWDDEYPTADDINNGQEPSHRYAQGMVDLHMSLFGYDGDLEIEEIRVIIWEEVFPTPVPLSFSEIAEEQGWDADSTIAILSGFIAENGNLDVLADYARAVADRENNFDGMDAL